MISHVAEYITRVSAIKIMIVSKNKLLKFLKYLYPQMVIRNV